MLLLLSIWGMLSAVVAVYMGNVECCLRAVVAVDMGNVACCCCCRYGEC